MQTMTSVYEYMKAYGPQLSERILSTFRPLHGPDDEDSHWLGKLKRTLLPAQKLVVMGVAKFLRTKNSAKIVGECGTGKTFMSIAACYVHADGKPHNGVVMAAPHLVEKWAREIFISIPNVRVLLIHDMRNGGDPRKPHGVTEVALKDGKIVKRGWQGSLNDLRRMGRKGWRKEFPQSTWFVLGRERGKLSYFWRHVAPVAKCGRNMGALVNPDSGARILNSEGEPLYKTDLKEVRRSEMIARGKTKGITVDDEEREDLSAGSKLYAPLWCADRSKIQRMAPLDYIGRYLKGWFDYAIADEVHELNGDTAQGQGLAVLQRAARKIIAMTGTIMGGYADDIEKILWRLDGPQMDRDGYSYGAQGRRAFQETYGTIEEIRKTYPEDNRCSRAARSEVRVRRRPGASPLLFGKYLLDNTAFIFLEDVADNLPGYVEEVVPIHMGKELSKAYEQLEEEIKQAMRDYPKAGSSITSLMLNTLLCYPDHPFGWKPLRALVRDEEGNLERIEVACPEELDRDTLQPKEEWLISDVRKERAEGRRVLVFATYPQEHDVPLRVEQVLRDAGFRVAVMRSSVPTNRRETWIQDRVREGVDVVICHPRLVQTGLDLPEFTTIVFYETGYSLYTLRQASRRSWRIGQRKNVRVKFAHYAGTMQERCLRLMGKKLMVALAVEGKFTNEGLPDVADEDAGDILTALARELVAQGKGGETADAVWASLAAQRAKVPTFATVTENAAEAEQQIDGPIVVVEIAPLETVPVFDEPAPAPTPISEDPGATPCAFAGDVLGFSESFLHKSKRRRKVDDVDPAQLSLFAELAGAA